VTSVDISTINIFYFLFLISYFLFLMESKSISEDKISNYNDDEIISVDYYHVIGPILDFPCCQLTIYPNTFQDILKYENRYYFDLEYGGGCFVV
jgi:hypothetical protein